VSNLMCLCCARLAVLPMCTFLSGQRPVFGPKTIPGMFTGYCPQSKAYRVYVGNGVWKESRDVSFIEHLRGAERVGLSRVQPGSVYDSRIPPPLGSEESGNVPSNSLCWLHLRFWDEDDDYGVETLPTGSAGTSGHRVVNQSGEPWDKLELDLKSLATRTSPQPHQGPHSSPGQYWAICKI
jgi:hypothetical protein